MYDPFKRGRFSVGVRTLQVHDRKRSLRTLAELWYPAGESHFGQDYAHQTVDTYSLDDTGETRTQEAVRDAEAITGSHPLVVYSHGTSRWKRLSATFLCAHLASHGYVVAAIDHYETVVPRATGDDLVSNRPADVSFMLDTMIEGILAGDVRIEPSRMSAVGYSLGGWTVLSVPEKEDRIRAVVAHAPAGASKPRPGVFDGKLTFKWKREVPAMYLFAENDTLTTFDGEKELFKRAPAPKKSFVLRNADHMHFVDAVEEEHEYWRTTAELPLGLSYLREEMRPAEDLCAGQKAQTFTAGLTLAHLDAGLMWKDDARRWLGENVGEKLRAMGIDAYGSGRSAR